MDITLSLAAGIMIAASFWSLLNPGVELAKKINSNVMITIILGLLGGCFLLQLTDLILKKYSTNNKNKSIMLITSITIHNIPEGLAMGVAFGSVIYNIDGATILSAWLLAIGISLQNFPEGSAVSLPLLRDGMSRFKAFIIGSLTGIVEPLFGVIGALLVMKVRSILPLLLCFAAGAMLYVAIKELIPESQQNKKKNLMTFYTILGFTIMTLLDVLL